MKKLPLRQIKTYLSMLLFTLLALFVIFLGYFVVPNYDTVLWATTNPEKVRKVKQAYEEAYKEIEKSAVVLISPLQK